MIDVSPQNPDFSPGQPIYPELAQVIRVSSPSIGSNVYPSFTQQLLPPLTLRDRESCYLYEPNGIVLGAGYYDARLVGSYLGLPLYATTCCPTGGLSSSSSSGSPTLLPITRTSLGFDQTNSGTSLTLPQVTVLPGSLLVVVGSLVGALENITVKFGATTLNLDASQGLPGGAAVPGNINIFSGVVSGTQDIVLSVTGLIAAALTVQALQVANLTSNVLDKLAAASGLASTPDTGATATTTSAREYAQGAFALLVPGGTWSWSNSFASGGQDVNETVSGTPTSITEGYRVLSATGAVDAALGGITPAAWAGVVVTYK